MPACDDGCGDGCTDFCSDDGFCDDQGGLISAGGITQCDLGEPFQLLGNCCGYSMGGWVQMGYHNQNLVLFNSRKNDFQLHQAWVYAEKAIDTSNGFDLGGRIDYIYGTDGPDTQAFGINNDHWDNDWDNGPDNSGYGHAIPQLYGEAGYGDVSVKFGHFYTIIGWEVVAAPDNFFYSHAYTMYNSEPFTHTGVLATTNLSDDLSVYGGYVLGWDSGFEDNGDAFLGGASLALNDDVTLTYATVGGRFGRDVVNGANSERGYMHSIVTDVALTDQLQYIGQSDLLESEDAAGNVVRSTYGLNNYLIYTLSDCLAYGGRFEYYNANEGIYNSDNDIYALTMGVNFKPHANLLFRPEIRWDWVDGNPAGILEDNDDQQTTFGFDSIVLF